ncbi:ADP-ribosylglycohydrolase family protein [Catenuloplanes atrovinosus]|uniref:ADP-ribosylglycohydrolase n=1 Tax=Catenuloplanes atrovinosus TaxID=137266 RepID=A0AAE3YRI1_9ACTN|nr:ADP-ribosylglycohydrolase family protein [Catenuloplanes atrovinosus]MDR7278539.1 ADP-ribosylglycohydrolase [Catenuloplanes atrovinosus]
MRELARESRVRGCLLGGAVGDALGNPVEFDREPGVTDLELSADGLALITDDTQMTLFTVEGLIRSGGSGIPEAVYQAHRRWYDTQWLPGPPEHADGLAARPFLYARRAPGNACLSGLQLGRMGTFAHPANPDSKGCGSVMRSAPFGLWPAVSAEDAFARAAECAVHTHGHPTGYLAAGTFAAIVRHLLDGDDVRTATERAIGILTARERHEETLTALRRALDTPYAAGNAGIERIGLGWIAEEALAMAVYAALAFEEPDRTRDALLVSVNHAGDSDSTGAICGNLLGARHGEEALPAAWVARLEGLDTIGEIADDLVKAGA